MRLYRRCRETEEGCKPKVAGRERRHEEATRTAPEPAEPYGPRRCGGPEHTAGLSMSVGRWTTH